MRKNLTEIIFLLDRSGSMGGLEGDTIGGFNAFVENQRRLKGDTSLTVVLFDDKYEILVNGIQADRVRLTLKNYFVRGTTALYDAIGKTINEVGNRLSNTGEEERPAKVIFVITTDGLENASCEFDYGKVQSMIRHQQEVYDWEFMFMGANIDAVKEAEMIGISNGNAFNFQASSEGISEMYNDICEKVSSFRFSEID